LTIYDVVNPKAKIWTSQDIMLDMKQGRIAFAVVSFRGILGLTDKWFALHRSFSIGHRKRKIYSKYARNTGKSSGLDKKWPQAIDLSWLSSSRCFGCVMLGIPMVTEEHVGK
jgi:hypothetical protein